MVCELCLWDAKRAEGLHVWQCLPWGGSQQAGLAARRDCYLNLQGFVIFLP